MKILLFTPLFALIGSCSSTGNKIVEPKASYTITPKKGSQELSNMIAEVDSEIELPKKTPIPLEVNARVESWLHYFTERDRERFQRFLNRGEIYREAIQKILKENGVPQELYYQALIESGFTISARSHANAVGVWQFIAPTAKRYSLRVDSYVDERKDPIRSTVAAARYLRDLHNVFQSWYLAMSAYNAGESRIMNAIMNANSRDFWELAEKRALPRETMNYVPKFIAASIIAHHPERFGFKIKAPYVISEPAALTVPSRTRLPEIAAVIGVKLKDLKLLNPHLKGNIIPAKRAQYELWVPKGKLRSSEVFGLKLAKLKKVPVKRRVARKSSKRNRYHYIKRGDTLASISRKHNLKVSYLKKINGLKSSKLIAGRKLALGPTTPRKSQRLTKYKVRRGDSLYRIAKKFGVSINLIKRVNSIRRNRIYIGQILKIKTRG